MGYIVGQKNTKEILQHALETHKNERYQLRSTAIKESTIKYYRTVVHYLYITNFCNFCTA
jgi:hypothetical protein